jgi:acyl-CoA thioester hydrolase
LRPDDEFDMTVSVADIRTRTYVLHIAARTPEGNDVFHAVLTPICIVQEERRAINIPAPFKAALEKYRAACFAARVEAPTKTHAS